MITAKVLAFKHVYTNIEPFRSLALSIIDDYHASWSCWKEQMMQPKAEAEIP